MLVNGTRDIGDDAQGSTASATVDKGSASSHIGQTDVTAA
jgi:hypothetical protein